MTREVSGRSKRVSDDKKLIFMNAVIKLMFIISTVIVNIIMIITFTRQSLDLQSREIGQSLNLTLQ